MKKSSNNTKAHLSQKELNEFVVKYNVKQETWSSYNLYMDNWKKDYPKVVANNPIFNASDFNVIEGEINFKQDKNRIKQYVNQVLSTLILRKGEKSFYEYGVLFIVNDGSIIDDYMSKLDK